MNGILDESLVGLALLLSAGYVALSLGPRIVRQWLLAGMGRLLARAPKSLGLRRMAARLAAASAGHARGACGGCDGCGSAPKPPGAEISVPAAKIGRRV